MLNRSLLVPAPSHRHRMARDHRYKESPTLLVCSIWCSYPILIPPPPVSPHGPPLQPPQHDPSVTGRPYLQAQPLSSLPPSRLTLMPPAKLLPQLLAQLLPPPQQERLSQLPLVSLLLPPSRPPLMPPVRLLPQLLALLLPPPPPPRQERLPQLPRALLLCPLLPLPQAKHFWLLRAGQQRSRLLLPL